MLIANSFSFGAKKKELFSSFFVKGGDPNVVSKCNVYDEIKGVVIVVQNKMYHKISKMYHKIT